MSFPRRLLCALLTLLLALPAMQASACAPGSEGTGVAHHASAEIAGLHGDHAAHSGHAPSVPDGSKPAVAHHDCIGCVAPIDSRSYRPVDRLSLLPGKANWSPNPARLTDWLGSPDTPPPRQVL
ncbi:MULTISPECIES: hypothetical protein [unclassified Sphingobium]|uniref:hypothetical protein n=1 Tax=unclassified Sphingobium TaxID=2611147 RepID=UPI0022252DAA|nr:MULTISPECIES: hypothetical protein [unclassified Sphingobium]MCW2394589.1 hypothetical protein [Sphingobium sp. B8D3B]MCW2418103.1 hypothetical protein [Sphingobium sp. B8D3C]